VSHHRFTNITRDFKGTLDYILYTADSLAPGALLELPEEAEVRKQGLDGMCYGRWRTYVSTIEGKRVIMRRRRFRAVGKCQQMSVVPHAGEAASQQRPAKRHMEQRSHCTHGNLPLSSERRWRLRHIAMEAPTLGLWVGGALRRRSTCLCFSMRCLC
jgi:hypothetical protein